MCASSKTIPSFIFLLHKKRQVGAQIQAAGYNVRHVELQHVSFLFLFTGDFPSLLMIHPGLSSVSNSQ